MPIKYNFTKYDMLAEEIHELSQKRNTPFSKDEEVKKAEAVLIASFSSSHSWQTYKIIVEGNANSLNSPQLKNEFLTAKTEKWKEIKPTNIQEVSCMNIRDDLFYMWLSINVDKINRDKYKLAWFKLKQQFDEECDGISVQRSRI